MSAPPQTSPASTARAGRTMPWWGFGIANVVVTLVVAVLLWWLLVDPEWSALGIYPQPFTGLLFWTIIATVWVAFTCGWTGPARLPQPARGIVGIVIVLVIGFAVTFFFAYAWGHFDPTYAASRSGGDGYTSAQLIVLFAFFFYVTAAINWNHWPWEGRLPQPWAGVAQFGFLIIPTLVLYGLLALPGLAVGVDTSAAPISTPTLIGWFYSLIVAVVVTGLIWDNLPWRLIKSPTAMSLVSIVGNLVLGTIIYYVFGALANLLIGPANVAALGAGVTKFAAELGVCWVFWMIAWANVFGNRPTGRSTGLNLLIRTVVTLVLAVLTFLLYHDVVAGSVLHEPSVGATLHGEALGFMNWCVLIMLFYVLFLGSAGLPAPPPDAAEADAETIEHETGEPARS